MVSSTNYNYARIYFGNMIVDVKRNVISTEKFCEYYNTLEEAISNKLILDAYEYYSVLWSAKVFTPTPEKEKTVSLIKDRIDKTLNLMKALRCGDLIGYFEEVAKFISFRILSYKDFIRYYQAFNVFASIDPNRNLSKYARALLFLSDNIKYSNDKIAIVSDCKLKLYEYVSRFEENLSETVPNSYQVTQKNNKLKLFGFDKQTRSR